MAKPVQRERLDWEARMAAISTAGVRPLASATVSPGASSESTYTVSDDDVKRIVVAHSASGQLDIRVDLNATADASSFPIWPDTYFVLEVEKDDVVHIFNTSGGSVTVHLMEIR